MKIRKWEYILAFIMVIVLFAQFAVIGIVGEQINLSEKLVRMHIIANSDSPEDQSVKLEVRDAVNTYLATQLSECADRTTAVNIIVDNYDGIISVVNTTLAEHGYDYNVDVTLTDEYYPTRNYSDFTLPAGKYTSLQIKLGEAEGKNWWCVVFPPLCTSAVTENEFTAVSLTDDEIEYITLDDGATVFKFKILEIINTFAGKFER